MHLLHKSCTLGEESRQDLPQTQDLQRLLSSIGGEVRKHSPIVNMKVGSDFYENSLTSKTQSFSQSMTSFRLV